VKVASTVRRKIIGKVQRCNSPVIHPTPLPEGFQPKASTVNETGTLRIYS